MLSDFFVRALIGGIGISLTAGPLGCIIVWRRMAYFGDTIAHSALLGVALALLLDMNMTLAVFMVAVMLSLILLLLQKQNNLSSDSLLGILAHSSLAISLVILSFMSGLRIDLAAYLFGDVLSVSSTDLLLIWGGGIFAVIILGLLWQSLLAATVSEDIALAEGLQPQRARIVFMLLLALIIAIAMKIIGILLITALLIIPAATARHLTNRPLHMAIFAAIIGAIASVGGLYFSLYFDTPSGPSIVVAAFILFIVSLIPFQNLFVRGHENG